VPRDGALVELAVRDLHMCAAEVEDHRSVSEPTPLGDVPHQPAGPQRTPDEPAETVPVDGSECLGVVVPDGFITLDAEHDHLPPTGALREGTIVGMLERTGARRRRPGPSIGDRPQ